MTELIKVEIRKFNDEELNSVNARDLHKLLDINKHFTQWIEIQIKRGMFEKDTDFVSFNQKVKREIGATTRIEYI